MWFSASWRRSGIVGLFVGLLINGVPHEVSSALRSKRCVSSLYYQLTMLPGDRVVCSEFRVSEMPSNQVNT
jgi:hypothetical protein